MRRSIIILALVFGNALAGQAQAYENFIPSGTSYSTEVDSLPPLDSELGQAIGQTDIYETEIYRKARENAAYDSKLRRFFTDSGTPGGDQFIDY